MKGRICCPLSEELNLDHDHIIYDLPLLKPEMSSQNLASRKGQLNEGELVAFQATVKSQRLPVFTPCNSRLFAKEKARGKGLNLEELGRWEFVS
jgi:hypothetical protein